MATRFMGRVLNSQPQFGRGTNTAVFHISASASLSSGDTWVIGKLPHGAIPVQAVFYTQGQVEAKFGTSASLELFLDSATFVAGAYFSTKLLGPSQAISVSDDIALRFERVTMVANAGLSLGYVGDLVVTYVMPGQSN
jgi:hypothetical protein